MPSVTVQGLHSTLDDLLGLVQHPDVVDEGHLSRDCLLALVPYLTGDFLVEDCVGSRTVAFDDGVEGEFEFREEEEGVGFVPQLLEFS